MIIRSKAVVIRRSKPLCGQRQIRERQTRAAACVIATMLAAFAALSTSGANAQVLQRSDDGEVVPVGPGWAMAAPTSQQSGWSGSASVPAAYREAIAAAAARYDLSPALLDAVARTESRYRSDAVSPVGAVGIMQLMPATARALGVDPNDPVQNILGGAAYLRAQLDRFDGDIAKALAAYNAGPGRVIQYSGVPPFAETRAYVATNLDRLADHSLAAPDLTPALYQGDEQ
jgi:soluble lytic murein transglycosylase-like protein